MSNTTNKYVDASVTLKIIYSANVPVGIVWVGVGVSTDNTNFGNPWAGTDAAISLIRPPQFPTNFAPGPNGTYFFPGSQIFFAEASDWSSYATTPTVFIQVPSIANVCGAPNVLPLQWGMFVLNSTGFAFAAAATATYTGMTYTNT